MSIWHSNSVICLFPPTTKHIEEKQCFSHARSRRLILGLFFSKFNDEMSNFANFAFKFCHNQYLKRCFFVLCPYTVTMQFFSLKTTLYARYWTLNLFENFVCMYFLGFRFHILVESRVRFILCRYVNHSLN